MSNLEAIEPEQQKENKQQQPAKPAQQEEERWKPTPEEAELQVEIDNAIHYAHYEDALGPLDKLLVILKNEHAKKEYINLRKHIERLVQEKSAKEEKEKKQEIKFTVETSAINYRHIIGMHHLKKKLRDELTLLLHRREEYMQNRLAPSGILMYGLPGVGKSIFAEAAAGEFGLKIIKPELAQLFSQWVGETEKAINKLIFEDAVNNAPCIIFLDEIDSKIRKRENIEARGESAVNLNATTQFLESMQKANKKADMQVLFIGATNRIWDVDGAAKRPGRFGMLLYVRPPNIRERVQLFSYYLKPAPIMISPFGFLQLAFATSSFSQADIKNICDESKKELLLKNRQRILTMHVQASIRKGFKIGSLEPEVVDMHRKFLGYREKVRRKTGLIRWKNEIIEHEGKFTSEEKKLYKEMINDVKKRYKHLTYVRFVRFWAQYFPIG